MSNKEAIAAARNGQRAVTKYNVKSRYSTYNMPCVHRRGWRTIACDNDHDVVECTECGEQRVVPCNFDEDCC